jgi:hypothetical protein
VENQALRKAEVKDSGSNRDITAVFHYLTQKDQRRLGQS